MIVGFYHSYNDIHIGDLQLQQVPWNIWYELLRACGRAWTRHQADIWPFQSGVLYTIHYKEE